MIDDLPDPEHALAAEADPFVTAMEGETWDGQLLKPWTPPRLIAAQSMGMLYPYIGETGVDALRSTGIYPGALRDVIISTWLRLQDDATVRRAQLRPTEAMEHATIWAADKQLHNLLGDRFRTAYELFTQKMAALQEANGTPDTPPSAEGTPDPKASCPPAGGQNILR